MGCSSSSNIFWREIPPPVHYSHCHWPADLSESSLIVIVQVFKIANLAQVSQKNLAKHTAVSGPYIECKLVEADVVVGDQLQRSCYKPNTWSPQWDLEKFTFVSTENHAIPRVRFSAYNYNPTEDPSPLGDISFDCVPEMNGIHQKLFLIHPQTGTKKGEVEFSVTYSTLLALKGSRDDRAFEYERWQPIHGWGHTNNHFLPTDPKRWRRISAYPEEEAAAAESGVEAGTSPHEYGDVVDEVCLPVPPGWGVGQAWVTVATPEDPLGWVYSSSFESQVWYGYSENMTVRRRMWTRTIQKSCDQKTN